MVLKVICILFLFFIFIFYLKTSKHRKLLSLFKSDFIEVPILGHFYNFMNCNTREDIMTLCQSYGRQAIKHGGISKLWSLHLFYLVVADPELAEVVLRSALNKDEMMRQFGKILIGGNSSLLAPVPIWRSRRKINSAFFNTKNIKEFQKVFSKQSEIMVEQLRPQAGSGPFSVYTYLTTYAMDSIFENGLSVKMQTQFNHNDSYLKALQRFIKLMIIRGFRPWLHNDFIYKMTVNYKEVKKATDFILQITKSIIVKKENDPEHESDSFNKDLKRIGTKTMLDLRKKSPDDDKGYSDLELIEEAITILLAGTDTSATGIGFTLLMLSRHLDVQEKLYQELKLVFDDSNRPVEAEDLPHLKYLDAVIRESLRLYSPFPIISRKVDKDFKLPSGVTVCEGTGIIIHIWAINRNPRYWGEDAELFRPERFLDTAFKHPAQFMSFSAGPRNCIGYQYAMLSMKTQLATLLRHYRVLPASLPDNSESDSSTTADYAQTTPLRLKYEMIMRDVDNFSIKLKSRV